MPAPSGVVGLKISSERVHLAEYLASRGFHVQMLDWMSHDQNVDLIVTDEALASQHAEAHASGQLGLVGLGIDVPQGDSDVILGADAQGREVATAVELVLQIVTLRRERDVERVERERWAKIAMYDALTGLPNRRSWDRALDEFCRGLKSFCLAVIDVDFFKRVNQDVGHDIGDAVLREIAVAMRSRLRDGDVVARLGGDEFGMLLKDVHVDSAKGIIDRMRSYIANHLQDSNMPTATVSAGYVLSADDSIADRVHLYRAASRSLAAAKRQQRNCTVAYTSAWDADIRSAVQA